MDIIEEMGGIALGSRLKRLGERMQADAAQIIAEEGLPVQPAHMPLLAALDKQSMTIGQLALDTGGSQPGVTRGINQLEAIGFVQSGQGQDQRQRSLSLTSQGKAAVSRAKLVIWPRIGHAVDNLCHGRTGELLVQIAQIETDLDRMPLHRIPPPTANGLVIRPYDDSLARAFHDINAEWISSMFVLEQTDIDVLENPREKIIEPGGAILFVEAPGLGVVGTCALQKTGTSSFELTKMGVLECARGLKAGQFLLAATIEHAQTLGADPLYLLTNAICEAAIHLYEKNGFRHDAGIMRDYGARYERCNVAMRYTPD